MYLDADIAIANKPQVKFSMSPESVHELCRRDRVERDKATANYPVPFQIARLRTSIRALRGQAKICKP